MTPEAAQRHRELDITIEKLSNGSRGDPLIMSDGIVNISKTLQVILLSNYVTEEGCQSSRNSVIDTNRAKFGWKALMAVLVGCSTAFGLGMHLINTIFAAAPIP